MFGSEPFHEAFSGLAWSAPRALAMISVIPLLSRRALPGLLRSAIVAALLLPVVPVVMAELAAGPGTPRMWPLLLAKEAALGFLIGYALAIPFWAIESSGFLIDNQRGAGMGGDSNPLSESESSPLGILLHQSFLVTFLAAGGLQTLLAILYESYRIWEVTAWLPSFSAGLAQHYLSLLTHAMYLAVVLAAPVMIAMFLAEMTLALVNMFAPQLQVFVLASPVKSGVALFVLVAYFGVMVHHWDGPLRGMHDVLRVLTRLLQ